VGEGSVKDPLGSETGPGRVTHGGSQDNDSGSLRCVARYWHTDDFPFSLAGFRVCRTIQWTALALSARLAVIEFYQPHEP